MTRHFITHPQYQIVAGWDRPCQHYFLNVYDPSKEEEEAHLVYISMYDRALINRPYPLQFGLSLSELEAKMRELDLPIPDGLLHALEEDELLNQGNKDTTWPLPPA